MEKRRPKIDMEPQPLGSSRPRKGVVGEDLGRTQFTSGPGRRVSSPFRKTNFTDFSESDDELDAFSPKNNHKSFTPPPHNTKKLVKTKTPSKAKQSVASSFRPKARQLPKTTKDVGGDEEHKLGPSGRRPRPRPAFRKTGSYDSDVKMPPSDRPVLESKRRRKTSECDSFPLEELSPNGAKKLKTSMAHAKKAEPAPFPMDDELDAVDKEPYSTSTRKPVPFPVCMPSPQSSFPKRKPALFPLEPSLPQPQLLDPEPLTLRPFPMEDSSGSPREDSSDTDDELKMTENDTILTRGGPRPFPMSTSQFLPGPASIFKQSDEKSQKSGTRRSSPEHNDAGERSVDGVENADPSTICPYCDEPWPPAPSPTLIALLARTKRKSYADSRHGNPLGLKAPLAVFVELCQRHRFEMTHYPLALARGWPTRIDFTSLPGRIRTFRKELKRLLNQPDESKFWREVRDDAKEVGVAKVVSVTGQYATFERTQPGYYGEQGSIIIHQCLYSLFPPDTISTATILPLTPDQFLTRVLVPETGLLLIQQDMGLSAEDAMHVLDESKQYGIAMFPEEAQDAKVEEIGEQLARNRAKERRKVLEERGEADADVRREVEREKRQARKAHADEKEKPKARKKDKVGESGTDFEVVKEKSCIEARERSTARVAEATHQICHENQDSLMQDLYEEVTPGPARVANNSRKSSKPSWRSTRSPSTSPAPISMKCSSSSLGETNRTPHLSPQSEKRTENVVRSLQWSFSLDDDHSSSGLEDAPQRETVSIIHESIMPAGDSGSEGVEINEIETPKPQKKTRGRSGREVIAQANVVQSERTLGNEKQGLEVSVKEVFKTGGSQALGKTKRRKKGKAVNTVPPSNGGMSNSHSWLLSDSDC